MFSVLVAGIGLSFSLLLAVFADRAIRGAGTYKTLLVWPYAVAPVVADALLLGAGDDGTDTDVPPLVLATVLHSGWPVSMHVVAPGTDREAGDRRW